MGNSPSFRLVHTDGRTREDRAGAATPVSQPDASMDLPPPPEVLEPQNDLGTNGTLESESPDPVVPRPTGFDSNPFGPPAPNRDDLPELTRPPSSEAPPGYAENISTDLNQSFINGLGNEPRSPTDKASNKSNSQPSNEPRTKELIHGRRATQPVAKIETLLRTKSQSMPRLDASKSSPVDTAHNPGKSRSNWTTDLGQAVTIDAQTQWSGYQSPQLGQPITLHDATVQTDEETERYGAIVRRKSHSKPRKASCPVLNLERDVVKDRKKSNLCPIASSDVPIHDEEDRGCDKEPTSRSEKSRSSMEHALNISNSYTEPNKETVFMLEKEADSADSSSTIVYLLEAAEASSRPTSASSDSLRNRDDTSSLRSQLSEPRSVFKSQDYIIKTPILTEWMEGLMEVARQKGHRATLSSLYAELADRFRTKLLKRQRSSCVSLSHQNKRCGEISPSTGNLGYLALKYHPPRDELSRYSQGHEAVKGSRQQSCCHDHRCCPCCTG